MIPWILGLLAIAFVLYGIVWSILKALRKAAMRKLAESMRFSFLGKADEAIKESFYDIELLARKEKGILWNVMRGETNGIGVTIMDHRYAASSPTDSTSEQTLIVFESEYLQLPSFSLQKENAAVKLLAAMFNDEDINFDTHPDFSSRFHLKGPDPEAVRQLFGEEVLTFFERHNSLDLQGHGHKLVCYRMNKKMAVKDIVPALQQGLEIFRLLKN